MAASGFPTETLAQQGLRKLGRWARRLGIAADSTAAPLAVVRPSLALEGPEPEFAGPASTGTSPQSRVVIEPRDSQWAHVAWEIDPAARQAAEAAGGRQLALRLMDVTGQGGGPVHPYARQELVVDGDAREWYVPVPMSDRDYRVELGLRREGGGWIPLATSVAVRIPAGDRLEAAPEPLAPCCLDGPAAPPAAPSPPPAIPGLHERLYQQATSPRRRLGHGSEQLHEHGLDADEAAAGLRSGVGLWASGRNDSGAGLQARQRSFWLVADAELIVYGATDPSANLRIGQETVPLTEGGTFQVQVPFRDGDQDYPIWAVAADGEQERSIHLHFQRRTPLANVNSPDDSVAEWF